ncbi:phosphate ABC transporter substrate-binding protein [Halioxenophilus aromaticivorans]|uniref:Phosphate ABC transporter substrate-binding protein n=1 Tax=Halioxenophilus aromaticivorans TaxID=1306992 RepID=A0AAV3UAW2_9ALTE
MPFVSLHRFIACLLLTTFFCVSGWAQAGVVVIVHPSNANALSATDISRLFLGKKRSFPDGNEAIPIDQSDSSPIRAAFTETVLKKNEQQIKSYWAQQLFTGKGTPPKAVGNSSEVKKLVASNPALIGYVDSAEVDDSVKVVAEF